MIEEAFKWLYKTNIQAAVIGPVATGLLGIIPYALHKREKKKINIAELIQEIEELATEHWCSAGSDSDNHFRAAHSSQMLNGAANANGNVKRRRNGFSGLSHLGFVANPASINDGSRSTYCSPQHVCQVM